jgi:hypothetical protein
LQVPFASSENLPSLYQILSHLECQPSLSSDPSFYRMLSHVNGVFVLPCAASEPL